MGGKELAFRTYALPPQREQGRILTPGHGTDEFKDLIDHKADVSTMSVTDFDPRGNYKEAIDAVKGAGEGEIRIFRVHHGKTRAEYYIVCVDSKGSRLVGLKAKAVES